MQYFTQIAHNNMYFILKWQVPYAKLGILKFKIYISCCQIVIC